MNKEEQATIQTEVRALCSRVGFFCFLLAIYGIYRILRSGVSLDHKLYTYVPTILGFVGSFCATFYGVFVLSKESTWVIALSKFAGLIPYVAGVYMTFFLGFYGLYTLSAGFAALTLLRSLFFIVIGYKCVFCLWVTSEMDKRYA